MLAGAVAAPLPLLGVGGDSQKRLAASAFWSSAGTSQPVPGATSLGGSVRVGGDHRQAAGHRLDEDEPERFGDRGKDEQVGGIERLW